MFEPSPRGFGSDLKIVEANCSEREKNYFNIVVEGGITYNHAKQEEGKQRRTRGSRGEGQDEDSDKEICMQNLKLIKKDFLNAGEENQAPDKKKKFNEIMKKDKFLFKASN